MRLPDLLYADGLVVCGELEEDLRVMVGQFFEVCRRRGLKFNVNKSKVMVLKPLAHHHSNPQSLYGLYLLRSLHIFFQPHLTS